MNDPKPKPSLTQIARQMRARALAGPGEPIRQSLSGGLRLTLISRLPDRWQLSLSRPGVEPSPKEVEICRQFFGVPQAARREMPSQVVGGTRWYTVRLIWQEAGQLSLLEGESGPVAVVYNQYREGE